MTSLSEQKRLCDLLAKLKKTAISAKNRAKHFIGENPELYTHLYSKFLRIANEYTMMKDKYEETYGRYMPVYSQEEIERYERQKQAWKKAQDFFAKTPRNENSIMRMDRD